MLFIWGGVCSFTITYVWEYFNELFLTLRLLTAINWRERKFEIYNKKMVSTAKLAKLAALGGTLLGATALFAGLQGVEAGGKVQYLSTLLDIKLKAGWES